MEIKNFVTHSMGENIYLLIEKDHIAVVDPGGNYDEISGFIEENNYSLDYILLTHGHADHIGALNPLKEKFGGRVIAHLEEKELLETPEMNLSGRGKSGIRVYADQFITEEDMLDFQGNKIRFVHTPGHTGGSMLILIDDLMFSGDMLFRGTVGRSDLPTSDPEAMDRSIDLLRNMAKDYKVFPGHGEATTLFHEKKYNAFLK
ncbi:MAG: MBL fold metallo-hydrolase [Gallicola sp.]|nr:MBL fold metallo-hydrolase [Gallicola sp.]